MIAHANYLYHNVGSLSSQFQRSALLSLPKSELTFAFLLHDAFPADASVVHAGVAAVVLMRDRQSRAGVLGRSGVKPLAGVGPSG